MSTLRNTIKSLRQRTFESSDMRVSVASSGGLSPRAFSRLEPELPLSVAFKPTGFSRWLFSAGTSLSLIAILLWTLIRQAGEAQDLVSRVKKALA